MFVRVTIDVHQDDRLAVEMFAQGLAEARGRNTNLPYQTEDERRYWVMVARMKAAGAQPYQVERSLGTFTLPEGADPW